MPFPVMLFIVQAFDGRVKHLFVEQMFAFGVDTNRCSYTIIIEQVFEKCSHDILNNTKLRPIRHCYTPCLQCDVSAVRGSKELRHEYICNPHN